MARGHFEEDRSYLVVGLALAGLSGAVVGVVLGALLLSGCPSSVEYSPTNWGSPAGVYTFQTQLRITYTSAMAVIKAAFPNLPGLS